ncbi:MULTISPECIES: LysE family translocator [Chelativorans]|jgi:threonine/homoserine/homoserine lactone efflux protein|uniref:Lysine exporter protein (LYSE/YGGA) n=1 Tax=Chelativorans sp. (strain BNC1) TaxID=266779 RepID=Q11IH8_CHESB|nr:MULTISPECIES: LysE family translocator [Chelativorans]
MPETTALLSYTLACIAIIIVPGPTVTVIIANSIRHGARAGLLNVLGTQIGLASMLGVLALGLKAIVAGMGNLFEVVRLLGAAYLIWIGIRMWRSDGSLGMAEAPPRGDGSLILQGFVVFWSNPKTLIFFGAFIPQFINPANGTAWQALFLGAIFMFIAAVSDSFYAFAAGGAGAKLTKARVRLAERISGTCLISGGLWLALSRR